MDRDLARHTRLRRLEPLLVPVPALVAEQLPERLVGLLVVAPGERLRLAGAETREKLERVGDAAVERDADVRNE